MTTSQLLSMRQPPSKFTIVDICCDTTLTGFTVQMETPDTAKIAAVKRQLAERDSRGTLLTHKKNLRRDRDI
jgi:tRNA1(Val) A37 N6-methylase TrmN6